MQEASCVMADVRRARELYRYLQPNNLILSHLRRRSSTFDVHHDHTPSLSSALAPFCQLAALRCNAAKAMLNVMDRDLMYFLAEASMKKSNRDNEEIYEFVEDPIFLSCSSVPLKDRICELTLRMDRPDDQSRVPLFVIPDLTKSRFAGMSIISGPPHYRFYAGVPITTRDGINIGSLAIMDPNVRPNGLTRTEEDFLGRSAEQIMTYLETNRQAIEGRRSRQLAAGLEAFISGQLRIGDSVTKQTTQRVLRKRPKIAYGMSFESDNDSAATKDRTIPYKTSCTTNKRSNSIVSLESEISTSAPTTDTDEMKQTAQEGEPRSHSRTFARAANLLRECFGDLGAEGSVHLLSLSTKLGGNRSKLHGTIGSAGDLSGMVSQTDSTNIGKDGSLNQSTTPSRVAASSTASQPFLSDAQDQTETLNLDDDVLRELMRRYPGGRLWTLEDSVASSSEDEPRSRNTSSSQTEMVRRSSRRKRFELAALRAAFPSARQVLFTPLWDASTGSFAHGCFITTTLETRSFNSETELPFLNSFCSTVMAECSRLDTMMADRQKSDFVGTISHEMRSPLHGVLASVEFLADTDVTSFQRSLIETIDSCGRTLLDTINHVLDFSKVNSFQKHWQAANRRSAHGSRRNNYLGPDNSSKAISHGAPPLLQLFGPTDISTVLEEVVDGLVLGNTYNSGIDITDVSKEARGRGNNGVPTKSKSEAVDIILDVQQGDWTFMTQPGAVRRIIMNITGNAIKYTTQGTIKVQLQQKDAPEDSENARIMVLTVSDTGKGISPEFLASRLFIPFAQENALAPGAGLGMSIVRSIVLMLGGTIDVKSKIGQGTTVEVAVPMKRPLPGQMSTQATPHSGGTTGSGSSAGDGSILLLQNQAVGETVAFYQRNDKPDNSLAEALRHYVQDWYNIEYFDQEKLESSSIVLVEEEDLEDLMTKFVGAPGKRPVLVILCSVSSRHSNSLITSLEDRVSSPVEFVARPCGPNKLARSIRSALQKKQAIKARFSKVMNLGAIPEAITPPSTTTPSTACDPAGKELQELDLSANGEAGVIVQATETFAASQSSHNAQMAIRDPGAGLRTPRTQMSDHDAFPFPVQNEQKSKERGESNRSRAPSLNIEKQTTLTASEHILKQDTTSMTTDIIATNIDPHVLLVDDNKINLKLLETFLQRKRKYTRIEKAENGQEAVDAVRSAKEQFDIIFMDISMPIMNGFEATRAIRDLEEQRGENPGALVIALTGLASGRDQSEGFDSGCDIYMTKPVSFREVSKLLDNWEGHQNTDAGDSLQGEMTRLNLKLGSGVAVPVTTNGKVE